MVIKMWKKIGFITIILVFLALLESEAAAAQDEPIAFITEGPIALNLDQTAQVAITVKTSKQEGVQNLKFTAILSYTEGGVTNNYDNIRVSSSLSAIPPNTIQIIILTFHNTLPKMPIGPLSGHLVMSGSNDKGMSLPQSSLELKVNEHDAANVKLTFPSDESIESEIGNEEVDFPLLVKNESNENVSNLKYTLSMTSVKVGKTEEIKDISVASTIDSLGPSETKLINLTFTPIPERTVLGPIKGVLIITGTVGDGTPIPPVSIPIKLTQKAYHENFIYYVIVSSGILALIITLIAYAELRKKSMSMSKSVVVEGWNKDSWLSIFTVSTGILGLGATLGLPEETTNLFSTGQFTLLWAIFAVFIPIAPLFFFATVSKPPTTNVDFEGNILGFLASSFFVFWGVGGQVLTTGFFAYALTNNQAFDVPPVIGAIVLTALIIILSILYRYGLLSIIWEVNDDAIKSDQPVRVSRR